MSKCHLEKNYIITHDFQLVPTANFGAFVPDAEFIVQVKIIVNQYKNGLREVKINFPGINFQILDEFGGYVQTKDGFLSPKLRPSGAVAQSILVPSFNGQLESFTFLEPFLPTPIAGYIVQLNNFGGLSILGASQGGNYIPLGSHAMLPFTLTYFAEEVDGLCHNLVLSNGFTNTTQFTGGPANNGVRDSHINDAFDNVVAWTWQDNSMIANKTNGSSNVMVAVGQTIDGKIKNVQVTQLTDYTGGDQPFDTSVAINRANKQNIVVSWGFILRTILPITTIKMRSYSFDGGITWSIPAPLALPDIPESFGDCEGVQSDKYGNIWYGFTVRTVPNNISVNTPAFAVSTDGGVTFTLIYRASLVPFPNSYDYPQYCFGVNASGQYGLHFISGFNNRIGGDGVFPFVGFIPIPATGPVPIASTDTGAYLNRFVNQVVINDITASDDGRVWFYGPNSIVITEMLGVNTIYKSPGALNENYAGPWLNAITKSPLPASEGRSNFLSQPVRGYIPASVRSIIYDNKLEALYGLTSQAIQATQNMKLILTISRNNGETWSDGFEIATCVSGNRGFQSMALDPVTGNLLFGWYDGRNDPTFTGLEYFAGILKAKKLIKLVNAIPLSNPILLTGPADLPLVAVAAEEQVKAKKSSRWPENEHEPAQ